MTSVLSKFIFNPYIFEYSTKVFTSSVNEFDEHRMKICVSALVYCSIAFTFFRFLYVISILVLVRQSTVFDFLVFCESYLPSE